MTKNFPSVSHIAFCISSFRAGGGEKQMVEIANAFVKFGNRVDLLVLKPVGDLASQVDPHIRVVSFDAGRIAFSLPKFISYLHREHPDALLANDEYTHLLALIARSITGVHTRIVFRLGNMFSILFKGYKGMKNKLIFFLIQRIYKKADAIIANSHGVADDIIAVSGIDPARVTVIMNPKSQKDILEKAKESVEHEWFTHKTVPIIVAVGRLRVQKNFQLIIRAFERLPHDIPARLVIMGAGREKARLQNVADETGCADRVHFTGYVANPYAYLNKADVFVAASLWEGLPNSVLEALMCGTPIIAADCSSGPREILAPDTDYHRRLAQGDGVEYAHYGALTAVNDVPALVEALTRFLTDKELCKKYAELSVERSKDFDFNLIIEKYAHILLNAPKP